MLVNEFSFTATAHKQIKCEWQPTLSFLGFLFLSTGRAFAADGSGGGWVRGSGGWMGGAGGGGATISAGTVGAPTVDTPQ